MPNKKQWGNANGIDQLFQADMESPAPAQGDTGYHLHVTDIQNDADTALKCANTDGVDAKAFSALGKSVMEAISADDPASTALEVINESANANARALVVEGKTDLNGAVVIPNLADSAVTALKVKNLDGVSSKALEAEGQSVIKANVVGGSDSTGLIVTNLSYRTGSKADGAGFSRTLLKHLRLL